MVEQPKRMTAYEFVKKVLSGERDFSGVNLSGVNLNRYEGFKEMQKYLKDAEDLQESPFNLTNSDLRGVIARGLYFPFVNGCGADLRGACFVGADLRGANLLRASLYETSLIEATLSGACFSEANLNGVQFARANLSRADFGGYAILIGVNLNGANLSEANLRGANLSMADLSEADLSGANLSGTQFYDANLGKADLRGAKNLEKTVHLEFAKFSGTIVTPEQKAYIMAALEAGKFDVRDE